MNKNTYKHNIIYMYSKCKGRVTLKNQGNPILTRLHFNSLGTFTCTLIVIRGHT
jgi:hypothetical protein